MKTSLTAGRRLAVAVTLAGAVALSACSTAEPTASTTPPPTTMTTTAPAAAAPFGPGCAGLPASGPGSADAIANQPVATAASQVPDLSTLVSAVTAAGLVDTLNSADGVTVFAPTNDAFAKIPKATLDGVLADKATLSGILTYHVVPGRRTAADLASGPLTTLQGGTLTAAGSGDAYTINDASVVCGNLTTGNAVVHVIDTVLMPKS